MVRAGQVVVLNGTSSAGKTSLAYAFQARRADAGECWVVLGIDDFLGRLPARWIGIPGHEGSDAVIGALLVGTGDTAHFEFGPLGQQLLRGYRRSVRALADAGLGVVVDEVLVDDVAAADWAEVLAGVAVTWVAVRCDLDEAARREAVRGDRIPGLARGNAAFAHRQPVYDIELDSTHTPVGDLVAALDAVVEASSDR